MTVRSITFHGDRAGGRAVGKPVTAGLALPNDPVSIAKGARSFLLSGEWRSLPRTGSDQDRAEYGLRVHVPAALALFPKPALHALTRNPDQAGCRWDLARFFAALDGVPEPERTEATLALLGEPCGPCSRRHAARARVAEVRAEVDLEQQLQASGASPLAARVVTIGRRLGLPRNQVARALSRALDPPARPLALVDGHCRPFVA